MATPVANRVPRPQPKVAEKMQARTNSDRPTIFSPEGVLMLSVAAFADLVPPLIVLPLDIIFGIGEILSWILDITLTITLGSWMFIRGGGQLIGRKKLTKFLQRRAPLMLGEYIPIAGDILPLWLINVVLFLQESDE